LGAGEVEVFCDAEVVAVGGLDEGDDLFCDRVWGEDWRGWNGDLVLIGIAIGGVVRELAADGFCVLHEDAGLLAHAAVEAVHHVGLAGFEGAVGVEEVLGGGGPARARRASCR